MQFLFLRGVGVCGAVVEYLTFLFALNEENQEKGRLVNRGDHVCII